VSNKPKTSNIKKGNEQEVNFSDSDIKKLAAFFEIMIEIDQRQKRNSINQIK
jgi:hypothetical protein